MGDKDEKVKLEVIEMGEPRPVELEVPVPEEKTKGKRGRKKKQEKNEHVELEQNLTVMVKTVFDLLALRDPIWKLADQEVEAVTKPGARILARMGAEEETNKNADYLLLAVGVAGILLPRIMIIRARGQVKQDERTPDQAGAGGSKTVKSGPPSGGNNVKQLLPALG
jgi:hypothetical protein